MQPRTDSQFTQQWVVLPVDGVRLGEQTASQTALGGPQDGTARTVCFCRPRIRTWLSLACSQPICLGREKDCDRKTWPRLWMCCHSSARPHSTPRTAHRCFGYLTPPPRKPFLLSPSYSSHTKINTTTTSSTHSFYNWLSAKDDNHQNNYRHDREPLLRMTIRSPDGALTRYLLPNGSSPELFV